MEVIYGGMNSMKEKVEEVVAVIEKRQGVSNQDLIRLVHCVVSMV